MMRPNLDRHIAGWRGPLLAALLTLVAGLPGLLLLPPLDRDESRYAQATSQMLESGDYVDIRFQDEPRWKKPVGIYWMQALAVATVSQVENRDIAPYRIPSLLGAILAAAACAWAGAALFGQRAGFLGGILLGATFLLSSEAGIAKTDAMLCGAVTLAMAALARIYMAARADKAPQRLHKLLFWLGLDRPDRDSAGHDRPVRLGPGPDMDASPRLGLGPAAGRPDRRSLGHRHHHRHRRRVLAGGDRGRPRTEIDRCP